MTLSLFFFLGVFFLVFSFPLMWDLDTIALAWDTASYMPRGSGGHTQYFEHLHFTDAFCLFVLFAFFYFFLLFFFQRAGIRKWNLVGTV